MFRTSRPLAHGLPHNGTGATTSESRPTGATRFTTRARLTDAADACHYLEQAYMPGLHAFAEAFELEHGRKPCDQDFPVELIRLVPPAPVHAPLLIMGGMGPLAGAQAMQEAISPSWCWPRARKCPKSSGSSGSEAHPTCRPCWRRPLSPIGPERGRPGTQP